MKSYAVLKYTGEKVVNGWLDRGKIGHIYHPTDFKTSQAVVFFQYAIFITLSTLPFPSPLLPPPQNLLIILPSPQSKDDPSVSY